MGYPMSWRRVLNRNGLEFPPGAESDDYSQHIAMRWWPQGPTNLGLVPDEQLRAQVREACAHWSEERERVIGHAGMLMGDLRRFERDSTDEQTTCQQIAARTGIDPEMVAVVLSELFAR